MPANPNWTRWIFASVADYLKQVAIDNSLPVLVEHHDERSATFMQATDRAEIRITGPFTQEQSNNYFRIWLDVNVLLTSRYDGSMKNAHNILKHAGQFHHAMDQPIAVWNYGNEAGDFVEDEPATQDFIGCLVPRSGNDNMVRVFHFGQTEKTDKLKQTAIDARYQMYLSE